MLSKIKARLQRIKPNDTVMVKDEHGNVRVGSIKEYTPDRITLEITRYEQFDAKKVTMEKI